jgi:hypothetical protein
LGFDFDKAHRRTNDGFGDRLGITSVILVGPEKGFTNWAGIILTVCPIAASFLASH